MNLIEQTVSELRNAASFAGNKKALVGIDGFVDKIVHPVDQRTGPGSKFTAISTITDFGARISSAAGKSANIELAPVIQKLGGNGPIMANAQHAQGIKVQYIGALGNPSIHPVFKTFAQKTSAVSITDPGVTHAAEFTDGKIMFGSMASLDAITYSALIDTMGIDDLTQAFRQADAISMVNWTMIPFLSDIFDNFLNQLLPKLPKNSERIFFFDLADPEKRSADDLLNVLNLFSQFEAFGQVILGLNYREAEQIDTLLGFEKLEKNPANLQLVAARIREKLKLNTVVVHPVECAACATSQGTEFIDGPLCENPKITTGAGDHFNSGFVTARMLGLSPASALIVAVATSGYYVRTAQSPSLETIAEFISTW